MSNQHIIDIYEEYILQKKEKRKVFLERKNALEVCLTLAEKGQKEACFLVAKCFHEGILTEKNLEESFLWYTKGAQLGEVMCQGNLYVLYVLGHGVQKDYKTGLLWLQKAVAQNTSASSISNLASRYAEGWIVDNATLVEQNIAKAIELYDRAGQLGKSSAYTKIGKLLSGKDATTEDLQKSYEAYLKVDTAKAKQVFLRIQELKWAPEITKLLPMLKSKEASIVQQGLELIEVSDGGLIETISMGIKLSDEAKVTGGKNLPYGYDMARLGLFVLGPNYQDVRNLDLSGMTLVGLPNNFYRLAAIEELDMARVRLDFWPESLANMRNLHRLDLHRNSIEVVPDILSGFPKMKSLNLALNRKITQLPPSIGQMILLERLYLGYNKLSSLPEEMINLQSLRYLGLGYNEFSTLPDFLGQLTTLQSINITANRSLTKLPNSLANLPNLKQIFAGYGNYDAIAASAATIFGSKVEVVRSGWRR
jgi:hypothetical protein